MFSCRSSSTSLPFSCSISNCGRWEWFGHYFPPLAGYLRPLPPHSAPSARIMGAAWLRIIDQQRIFLLTPLRPWNSEPFSRNPTKNGRHFKSFQFARAKRCPASVLFGSRATFGYGHLLTLYLVVLVLTFSSVNVLFRLVCIWIGWELFHLGPRPLLVTFVIYGTQRTALFNVPGNAPASCSSIFLFFFFLKKTGSDSGSVADSFIHNHFLSLPYSRSNAKIFTQVLAPSTVLLLEPILISFISNFYVFFCLLLALFLLLLLLHTSDFTEPAQKSNRAERPARFRRFKQTEAVQHQKFLNHEGKKKNVQGTPKKNKRKVNERHKKMKQMKQNNKRKKTTTITDDDDDDKLPRSTALTCIFFHL